MDKNREALDRNTRVSERYDALMAEGKHGHYETMFRIVREEIEAATAAAESERNNLLAFIAQKDSALQEVINVLEAPEHPGISDTVWVVGNSPETLYDCVAHAKSISPDNCKLVPVAKTRIVQTAEDEYDLDTYFNSASMSIVGDDTTLYAISTINDTISGRDGE